MPSMRNDLRATGFRLVISWIIVVACVFLFSKLTYELFFEGEVIPWDLWLLKAIRHYESPGLTGFLLVVTTLGSIYFIAIAGAICSLLFARKGRGKSAASVFAVTAGSLTLNLLLKELFARPRPTGLPPLISEAGFSYPSGHAMVAMSFYGFLITIILKSRIQPFAKTAGIVALSLLILGVGFSRLYLGVHYPTDVAAGYLAGFVWMLACIVSLG